MLGDAKRDQDLRRGTYPGVDVAPNARPANIINHIVFLLDASASMARVARDVTRVTDDEIGHLARRSRELDQETRATVYTFSAGQGLVPRTWGQDYTTRGGGPGRQEDVRCVYFDKDVLRMPSLTSSREYVPAGMTPLLDATGRALDELADTSQLYGDHAFLVYVLTDGAENASLVETPTSIARRLGGLPENWTVAVLIPHESYRRATEALGFAPGNIAVWDAESRAGVEAGAAVVRTATESFMVSRSQGVRGSKTLFTGGADAVNTAKVRASQGFKPLAKDKYSLVTARDDMPEEIRPFVIAVRGGGEYEKGCAFYELTKPEKIQPQKTILMRNRRSGRVYAGADARKLLNLPDHEVRVRPEANPEFQIFVQSTSVNRKLVAGTKVIVLAAGVTV